MARRLLLLSCILALANMSRMFAVYGKTYLSFRPAFEVGTPLRLSLMQDAMNAREDGKGGTVQAVVFGGQTGDPVDIARYFLPNDRACVRVAEDMNNNFLRADINAAYVGVVTVPIANKNAAEINAIIPQMTFESMLTFKPRRTEVGLGGVYMQRLSENFWFDVSASVIQARHCLGVCENIINAGGPGPSAGFGYANVTQMMCACPSPVTYGRWTNKLMKITRCPQVEIRLGDRYEHCPGCETNGYLGFIIPTGNKPCQFFLFEPVVGNGKHAGWYTGLNGTYALTNTDERTFAFHFDVLTRYLFSNNQMRSFDLKGRPWSRYMWAWLNNNELSTPTVAANIAAANEQLANLVDHSTFCVNVAPGWSADASIAGQFKKGGFSLEVGYHAYAKEAEDICWLCNNCFKSGMGVEALSNYMRRWAADDPRPKTRSFARPYDYVFAANPDVVDSIANSTVTAWPSTYVEIKQEDLDITSAQQPATFAQGFYASMGYTWQDCTYPPMLFIGGSYDCASDNSFISNWKVWLRLGVSF